MSDHMELLGLEQLARPATDARRPRKVPFGRVVERRSGARVGPER
jgi:hypothetical protein